MKKTLKLDMACIFFLLVFSHPVFGNDALALTMCETYKGYLSSFLAVTIVQYFFFVA